MEENKALEYYVYAHFDNKGHQFYIGMGKDMRAWSNASRNKDWWDHALSDGKVCFEVELLKVGLTQDEAYDFERECINEYGLDCLSNKQEGRKDKRIREYELIHKLL